MNRPTAMVLACLTLALGFAAGRWTEAPPPLTDTPAATPPRSAAPGTVVEQESAPVVASSADALAACEKQLALVTSIMDAQVTERVGTPVSFPDDLPEPYTYAGFEPAVRNAVESCDSSLELAHIDCSEFPCMAFFSQPRGSMNHAVGALRACHVWRQTFRDHGGQANSRFMTDEGLVEYSVAVPRPADSDFDDNASKRWHSRLEEGEAALMEVWGGRELTELEEIDESIKFWRRAGNEERVRELEARRARVQIGTDRE